MSREVVWTISTHAPRTGSDRNTPRFYQSGIHFNPRSPHGERLLASAPKPAGQYFNPRSPHGERRLQGVHHIVDAAISTHAPRTGSDLLLVVLVLADCDFNPRSPHGERRNREREEHANENFNPRSPHGERQKLRENAQHVQHFNPRSPHGERRLLLGLMVCMILPFQPTLPARGATRRSVQLGGQLPHFNPRSPHGERRLEMGGNDQWSNNFNPRSPHGERQRKVTILSIRIIGFAQKVYHKTVLLRISLAENAVILPKRPQNPVRTSLQRAGGLRFARAIRAARPYSISSPSGA